MNKTSGNNQAEFSSTLIKWYAENKRELPWRSNPSPYNIWVSEIMLQQTQVIKVIPYFERFIDSFPNFYLLAQAKEDTLLKIWEGLGYYTRVRNMKRCAEILVRDYDGMLPKTREELESLPGIGPYTAGAILSIAYGQRELAADGNVYRVMARITNNRHDLRDPDFLRGLRKDALNLMPYENLSDYTQAFFEQGALICTPKKPNCPSCAIQSFCLSYKHNTQDSIPFISKAKKKNIRYVTVIRIDRDGLTAIQKREDKKLMGGLWELLTLEEHINEMFVQESFEQLGYKVKVNVKGKRRTIFTHIDWRIQDIYVEILDEFIPQFEQMDIHAHRIISFFDFCLWVPLEKVLDHYAFSKVYLGAFQN